MRKLLTSVAILPLMLGVSMSVPADAQSTPTILGAFVDGDFEQFSDFSKDLTTAGANVGISTSLGIDNRYFNFVSWNSGDSQIQFERLAQQDIPAGFTPMISWSAGDGNGGCVLLWDIKQGKYDKSVLSDNAQLLLSLGPNVTVQIRLFYEMTDSPDETCANPQSSPVLYQKAFQHVVDYMNANVVAQGGPTLVWVFAPGEPAFETLQGNPPVWPSYYPGSDYVDIIAEDLYNRKDADVDFPGEVCQQTTGYDKPLMISETGAFASAPSVQVYWLNSVRAKCPNLYAFLYWDSQVPNGFDYIIDDSDTTPQGALAAFAELAPQGGAATRRNKH